MPSGEYLATCNKQRAEKMRAAQLLNYVVDTTTQCWIWQGGVDKDGYGKTKRFGQDIRSHQLFYQHHKGPIGELFVCHTCDNPPCVNPAHLFLGTQIDNEADKDRKGRRPPSIFVKGHKCGPSGESHHKAKLKLGDIGDIRANIKIPTRELADKYGVSMSTIQRIRNGSLWKESGTVPRP
jgi:hypothetical protein